MMKVISALVCLCLSVPILVGQVYPSTFGSAKLLHAIWSKQRLTSSFGQVLSPVTTEPDTHIPTCADVSVLPALDDAWFGNVRSVNIASGGKYVAITFDYCELCTNVNGYQPEVIQYLRQHQVPATLFMSGKWMHSHSDITLQLIADPLFEIGNHAWSHANLALTPPDVLDQQVLATQAEYIRLRDQQCQKAMKLGLENELKLIPQQMTLFRLPYGRCNDVALQRLQHLGLKVIQWSHVGLEGYQTSEKDVENFVNSLKSGSIILLHGNNVPKHTLAFLKRLVPMLQSRGYTCVAMSELLEKGTPQLVKEGYFLKPEDNINLDTQFGIMGTGINKLRSKD